MHVPSGCVVGIWRVLAGAHVSFCRRSSRVLQRPQMSSQAWMKRNVATPVWVPLSDSVSAALSPSSHALNCATNPPLVVLQVPSLQRVRGWPPLPAARTTLPRPILPAANPRRSGHGSRCPSALRRSGSAAEAMHGCVAASVAARMAEAMMHGLAEAVMHGVVHAQQLCHGVCGASQRAGGARAFPLVLPLDPLRRTVDGRDVAEVHACAAVARVDERVQPHALGQRVDEDPVDDVVLDVARFAFPAMEVSRADGLVLVVALVAGGVGSLGTVPCTQHPARWFPRRSAATWGPATRAGDPDTHAAAATAQSAAGSVRDQAVPTRRRGAATLHRCRGPTEGSRAGRTRKVEKQEVTVASVAHEVFHREQDALARRDLPLADRRRVVSRRSVSEDHDAVGAVTELLHEQVAHEIDVCAAALEFVGCARVAAPDEQRTLPPACIRCCRVWIGMHAHGCSDNAMHGTQRQREAQARAWGGQMCGGRRGGLAAAQPRAQHALRQHPR